MQTAAAAPGISDVGPKKVCAKAGMPVPDRGDWARPAAGQPVKRPLLPLRDPDQSEEPTAGGEPSPMR